MKHADIPQHRDHVSLALTLTRACRGALSHAVPAGPLGSRSPLNVSLGWRTSGLFIEVDICVTRCMCTKAQKHSPPPLD